MEDITIVPDDDIQTINLDLNVPTTTDDSLGIELLADPKKSIKVDGYSSGDDKPVSPKKEFNIIKIWLKEDIPLNQISQINNSFSKSKCIVKKNN